MDTYEKKYNEALERAKAYHRNELAGSRKEMTEYIFPELRESEDERMMREFNDWLCEEIECRTNDLRDEKDRRTLNMLCYILTKVKDWLEKQKEPTTEELYAEAGTTEKEYIANTMKMVRAMREKKQEQKPAEIDFEDWDTLGYIRDIVRKHVRRDEEFNVLDKWLTEHYVNQKPADKEQDSIAFLEQYGYTIVPPHAPVSIVPSSEATFTEWSEEDEKDVAHIIRILDDCYAYGRHDLSKTDHENLVNKLKSLRPSWKPSEEQMYVLERLISRYRYCWDEDTRKTMELLDEDLKRL